MRARYSGLQAATIVGLLISGAVSYVDFPSCEERVLGIIERGEVYGDIDNVTLEERGYRHHGIIHGLRPPLSSNTTVALTYAGCVKICGEGTRYVETDWALEMVATWIFPLAIIVSLPYEWKKGELLGGTVSATLRWLGSPQTALTATLDNFRQVVTAHRMTAFDGGEPVSTSNDALYVLTCLSQFEIMGTSDVRYIDFLNPLLYGLFRPSVLGSQHLEDGKITKQLLSQLAFELRILRRAAVIPTLASLGTYLAAFTISVVSLFVKVGYGSVVAPLVLGLVFSWLPVLVTLMIVDRNPISSERTGILLSRWLFNVNAVMLWVQSNGTSASDIAWWPPQNQPGGTAQNAFATEDFIKVREFIGQGRTSKSNWLPQVVMSEFDANRDHVRNMDANYAVFANNVHASVKMGRHSYWVIALVSEAFVVIQLLLAFMLAFSTPTVGVGCFSGSVALYGILSSIPWALALFPPEQGPARNAISQTFNSLAFIWLIIFIALVLTGATNTCWCQVSPLMPPIYGGYLTFEDTLAFRELYDVVTTWSVAAGLGLAIPMVIFLLATILWYECSHLWKVDAGRNIEEELRDSKVDWKWLT